jgi:AraC-like DNA-binding protein
MIETEFRTDRLPVADRFHGWHEMASRSLIPTAIVSKHAPNFVARARILDLGVGQVSNLTFPPLESLRSAKLIHQSDPESLQAGLILGGGYGFTQLERETTLGAGDLLLYDSSRPFHAWPVPCRPEPCRIVILQFPRTRLPVPPNAVDRLLANPLPSRAGLGALVAGCLGELVAPAGYRERELTRLAAITLDLLASLCAHETDVVAALPAHTRHEAMLAQIQGFIEDHLGDRALTPDTLAAAHHVSVRQLHRIFQAHGWTVAGWIRRRRLECCRTDLSDPRLAGRPLQAIAARWGLPDKAHFSRIFRAAYGLPPRDYRAQALLRDGTGTD